MKHKKLFISLTAIFTVLIFLSIFLLLWFCADTYPDFKKAKAEFEIPGLEEGAIPQGMTSCYANYTVETTDKDEQGNDVTVTETKMQPYFFISAYMNDGSPSRIYVVGKETGYVGYVTVKDAEGNPFYGHCGGIAINNYANESGTAITTKTVAKYYTLWITCDDTVYVAKCSEAYANKQKSIAQEIVEKAARIKLNAGEAESGETVEEEYDFTVQFTSSFNANCEASFCYYFDDPSRGGSSSSVIYDRLYVGEFYNGKKYKTVDSHKMTTPNGYANNAVMYEYKVTYDGEYGLTKISNSSSSTDPVPQDNLVPAIQKIFSIPEKVQGVAWSGRDAYGSDNGIMVLSQSYGLPNSHLLCFDYKTLVSNSNRKLYSQINDNVNFVYEGVKRESGKDYTDPDLYVYFADKANAEMLLDDLSVPSMAEGLCSVTSPASGGSGVNQVYVLFESGSKKYRIFVRSKMTSVYSLRLNA